MNIFLNPDKKDWDEILKRPLFDASGLENKVLPILLDIKNRGDKALKEYTAQFDQVELNDLIVSQSEFEEAASLVDQELKNAIQKAADNIKLFHEAQKSSVEKIETSPGVTCWRESRAISKVGLYIPGGTAPLFSTILMLTIPAQIAGCKEIVLCTPPNKKGKVHPAILFTAAFLGIEKVVKVGGSQAIGALTFGTESVPKVYKIFGPGNQYVTAAKQLATKFGVSIDMPAGPSEVAVLADDTANPDFIASDLLSQAEHGVDSQVILISSSEEMAKRANEAVLKQLKDLPRKEMAEKALANSKIIVMENLDHIIEMCNEYGPEHLIIQMEGYEKLIPQIENAGSVFLGNYTPESAGDYASGTNHTLPTNGFAKSYSGVSLDSFVKKVTFQEITKDGIKNLGPTIEVMAEAEELFAHKNAVTLRIKE